MRRELSLKYLLAAVLASAGMNASAYDFEVDGLYYNILDESDKTVEVTNNGNGGGLSGVYSAVIPETVTYDGETYTVTVIGNEAFNYYTDLTNVEIPNTVTSIENRAFNGCWSLMEVKMGNSVKTIGDHAFFNCESLASIDFPETLESIGMEAFTSCNSLTEVYIPASVNDYVFSFSRCENLMNINVDPDNQDFSSVDGVLYNKDQYMLTTVPGGKTSFEFLDVTGIINGEAFNGCKISSLYIPATIRSITSNPFKYCENLTEINVDPASQYYASVDGVLYTKDMKVLEAFPTAKTSVDIYDGTEEIGMMAFIHCDGLTSVEIPNSVTTIGNQALWECNNLERITLGSSVAEIGSQAFGGGEKVIEVTCLSTVPPVSTGTPASTFADEAYNNATLYVPEGCESVYRDVEPWSLFADIAELTGTGIGNVSADGKNVAVTAGDGVITVSGVAEGNVIEIYTVSGEQVYRGTDKSVGGLSAGIYVVNAGATTQKVVVR